MNDSIKTSGKPPPGRRRYLSIRWLVAMAVVLPIVIVAVVLFVVAGNSSHRISEDLGASIVSGLTRRISNQVTDHLTSAVRVSDLYARRIAEGRLSLQGNDFHAWEPFLFDDLANNPDVGSITFGSSQGAAVLMMRVHGHTLVGRSSGDPDCRTAEYMVDDMGTADPTPLQTYRYDPRTRPWYPAALANQQPVWSPVCFWFESPHEIHPDTMPAAASPGPSAQTLPARDQPADSLSRPLSIPAGRAPELQRTPSTGYARIIRDAHGRVAGVLVVDVTLHKLSNFLRESPVPAPGRVFIMDDQGLLVAASNGSVVSPDGKQLTPATSDDPVVRATAGVLPAQVPASNPSSSSPREPLLGAVVDGQPIRIKVSSLTPYPGIRWRVVTALPESAFLSEARRAGDQAVFLSAVATLLAVGLGLLVARLITKPVYRVGAFINQIRGGNFERAPRPAQTREMQRLSANLSEMAAGLKDRLELANSMALAKVVQQSLLPAGDPSHDGLDIAGRSQYCDATGGDYYDLIDLSPRLPRGMLIAVGDVSGHGIAAALLMASARAALRAHCHRVSGPAALMCQVNRVLATEARHERFMTMALLEIDGSGNLNWASAGHDPAIVYHPADDRFSELGGSDVPLGIDAGIVYQDHRYAALPPGVVLVIGTDGIWETYDADDRKYGKDRLREIIRRHHAQAAAGIAAAIQADLAAFRGICAPTDDVTFVVVKIKNSCASFARNQMSNDE